MPEVRNGHGGGGDGRGRSDCLKGSRRILVVLELFSTLMGVVETQTFTENEIVEH